MLKIIIQKNTQHRDKKGRYAKDPIKKQRILLLVAFAAAFIPGLYLYHFNPVVTSTVVNEPETRKPTVATVSAQVQPSSDPLYVPPEYVRQEMNKKPGLMRKISDRDWGADWTYAAELIFYESSFDKKAINPRSGSCGLPQSLPCSKMKCSLDDEDCQLDWMRDYIENRYEDAEKALWFWKYQKRRTGRGWY